MGDKDQDSQSLSEREKNRLYQEITKLLSADPQTSDFTQAPKRIDDILKKHGSSLKEVADHPEWLLGQSTNSGLSDPELVDRLKRSLEANAAFNAQNQELRRRNQRLKNSKFVLELSLFDQRTLNSQKREIAALSQTNKTLRSTIVGLETENSALESERDTLRDNLESAQDVIARLKEEKVRLKETFYRAQFEKPFDSDQSIPASGGVKADSAKPKKYTTPLFFSNRDNTRYEERYTVPEGYKYMPGSLNKEGQTELMFLCGQLVFPKWKPKGSKLDDGILEHYLSEEGGGIPDTKTTVQGLTEPQLVVMTGGSANAIEQYLQRIGKPVDFTLGQAISSVYGTDIYERAALYKNYSSDFKRKRSKAESTQELIDLTEGKGKENRYRILNIFRDFNWKIENDLSSNTSLLTEFLSTGEAEVRNIDALKSFHAIGGRARTDVTAELSLCVEGMRDKYQHTVSESSAVLFYAGVEGLEFYTHRMGGNVNVETPYKGLHETNERGFSSGYMTLESPAINEIDLIDRRAGHTSPTLHEERRAYEELALRFIQEKELEEDASPTDVLALPILGAGE